MVASHSSVPEGRKPLEASENSDLSIKVSKIEGKGEGVVATRNLKPGEVIFQEHALLKLATAEVQHDKIVMALAQLDNAQRDMYFHLHDCYTADEGYPGPPKSQTLGIWHTNAFGIHDNQQVVMIGHTSKLNHSCRPNASRIWCEERDTWTLIACDYIQAGQEVTCTYLDLLKDSVSRRRIALKLWGFLCQCEVCSLPADLLKQSDMRRAWLRRLLDSFEPWKPATEELIIEALDACFTEGLYGFFYLFSERHVEDCVELSLMHEASQWAKVAAKHRSYVAGATDEGVLFLQRCIEEPDLYRERMRSYETWSEQCKRMLFRTVASLR